MAITSVFEIEDLLIAQIKTLIDDDMVFVEASSSMVNNDLFNDKVNNSSSVGVLVLNSGFRMDGLIGNSRNPNQQMKTMWNIVVVCPKDLYRTHGGIMQMNIIQLLKGVRLSPLFLPMYAVTDERGFNQPEFIVDLVYLPTMFSVETVV